MENEKNLNSIDHGVISDPMMEQQIARGITDLLNNHAQKVSPEQEQRLSAAREAAVSCLAGQQVQYGADHSISGHSHVLRWFGHNVEQHRLASGALLVVVVLLTFFAVQQFGFNHNLENSDAFLLASDLPPEAYADKGFDAWIDSN